MSAGVVSVAGIWISADAARRMTTYPYDERHEIARFFQRPGFSA